MSTPSPSASQTDFCYALYLVNTTLEPQVVVTHPSQSQGYQMGHLTTPSVQ